MRKTYTKMSSLVIIGLMILSGCVEDDIVEQVENGDPQAIMTVAGATGFEQFVRVTVGDTVDFDGSLSIDLDGTIESYEWDFGDSNSASGESTSHVYTISGDYEATLTVTDDVGSTGTDSMIVAVEDAPVEEVPDRAVVVVSADIWEDTTEIEAGIEAYFDCYDSTVTIVENGEKTWGNLSDASCTWDFGDGSDTVTQSGDDIWEGVLHSFETWEDEDYGEYFVYLTVTYTTADGDTYSDDDGVYIYAFEPEDPLDKWINRPDTFTTTTIGDPASLDPAHAYDTASGEVIQNVYQTLFWYDKERTDYLIPVLATEIPTKANGGLSEDGLNYTVNIREGVKFHDGSEMTADDVVFSLSRILIMDLGDGPAWMYWEIFGNEDANNDSVVDSITKIDDYTVKFTLSAPAPFPAIMAFWGGAVVSKAFMEGHGCGTPEAGVECEEVETGRDCTDGWDSDDCPMMGTGPYMFRKWEDGQYVLMDYFPDYWENEGNAWDTDYRKSKGLPGNFIKHIFIRSNTDKDSRILEFLNGEADFAYVPIADRDTVEGKDGVRTIEGYPTFNMGFIGFNFDIQYDWINATADNPGPAPSADFFADPNVRLAFCYAWPYADFIEFELDNSAIQPRGPIPAGMLGYPEDGAQFHLNLEASEEYFREAGVWDDGFEMTLYYNTGNTARENGLLWLENNIEGLNEKFSIDVQGLEWPDYLDKLYGGETPMFFLGWAPDYADPHDYAHPFLHSDGVFPHYFTGYANADIDALIEEAVQSDDPDVRADLYAQVAELEHADPAYIWTHQGITFHVERDWVQGYYSNPMHSGPYYYDLAKGYTAES